MQLAPIVALLVSLHVSPERAESIALDVTAVTSSRHETALLLAVAWKESAFAEDVDNGTRRGDGGRACTLWQIQGHGCPARRDAARIALQKIRQSFAACHRNAPEERLAAYASGSCDRGLAASRNRIAVARRFYDMLASP